ncbi:hypothetical protein GV789_11515, partial [Nocardia cyriacigeorgica]|nr:hypothetical protein [Nocardia cyriacigeorgica]
TRSTGRHDSELDRLRRRGDPADPGADLAEDPAGQPGITGPIPEGTPPATDQPGVIPPQG